MSAGPKSCPAGLEIFGVRRRPAPWVLAHWPGLSDVSETRLRPSPNSNPPAGQACQPSPPSLRPKLSEPNQQPAGPKSSSKPSPGPGASQGMPATRPAPSSQPTSRLSPTCLRRQLLSLSDVPQPLSPAAQAAQPRLPCRVRPQVIHQLSPFESLKVCQPACWRVLRVCDLRPSPASNLPPSLRPKCV